MRMSLIKCRYLLFLSKYCLKSIPFYSHRLYSRDHQYKSELLDAFSDCRQLKFKAQRCLESNHSFSQSSAHAMFDYFADGEGNFRDTRNPENASFELFKYSVRFDTLFKKAFIIVNSFLDDERPKVDCDSFLAIGSLLTYLNALDFHQECLQSLLEIPKRPETEIAIILAVHLFSKLSIDDSTPSYMISNEMSLKYKLCPCHNSNCKHEALYGNTNIGSEHLFHGHPDIVVFPKSAGSCSIVVPKRFRRNQQETLEVQNWDEDNEMQMTEVTPSKEILRRPANQNQIASIAITFSFYQRIRQYRKKLQSPTSGKVSIIPTIAVSQDCFDIYLYDTENDIFLINDGNPIPLWENETDINISSILTLWIVLNHLTFRPMVPNRMKAIGGSCGLSDPIDTRKLELIEKTFRMSSSKCMPVKAQDRIISKSKEIEFESDSDSE